MKIIDNGKNNIIKSNKTDEEYPNVFIQIKGDNNIIEFEDINISTGKKLI